MITTLRNKNAGKTLIDWDLNIYMPEQFNEELDDYYFDQATWSIHIYAYRDGDSNEWSDPIRLTAEEIQGLGLNRDKYFKDSTDAWYGLQAFRLDYWTKMSDRLKRTFDELPKYWEDLSK